MKKHFPEYKFDLRTRWGDYEPREIIRLMRGKADQEGGVYRLATYLLQVEQEVLEGNGVHYFIDTESLAETLPGLVRQWEPQFLDAVSNLKRGGCGIIHTTGKKARAILFGWHPGRDDGKDQLMVSAGGVTVVWLGETREEFAKKIKADHDLDLVFGLALYAHCFPAAIKEGFPDFAKHPAHFKGKVCASVSAVPEIIDRDGPTPHFRHGHFRMLRSARFTKKRFQVVFVSETFVKGKVKTVTEL